MKRTTDEDAHRGTHQRYISHPFLVDVDGTWVLYHRLMYREGCIEVWIHKTPTYEVLTERDLKSMLPVFAGI